jgi:hypothetical protein
VNITRALAFSLLSVLLSAGCSTQAPSEAHALPGLGPYSVTPEVELKIGQQPGLVAWHRDVVVICPLAEIAGTRENCEVHTLDAEGGLTRTGIRGARTARRVQQGILVLRPNLDLELVLADRSPKKLAALAAMPGVSPEGKRVAYVQQLGKGFVPVAMNQLVWIVGTRSAVFTAHYATDDIWLLDLSSQSLPARKLGPGALPNLKTGGGIVAFDKGPPHVERAPRVASYLEAP